MVLNLRGAGRGLRRLKGCRRRSRGSGLAVVRTCVIHVLRKTHSVPPAGNGGTASYDGRPHAGSRRYPGHPAEALPMPRSRRGVLVIATFENDEYVYEALRAGAIGFVLKRARPAQL